jgi:uncharacterized protein YciI
MSDPATEYLYRLTPTRPAMLVEGLTPEERAAVAEHVVYLERLAEAGVVLLFGRTQTTDAATFGIVIFRAASPAEAERRMADDPAVRARVMRGELFPFRVAGVSPSLRAPAGPGRRRATGLRTTGPGPASRPVR